MNWLKPIAASATGGATFVAMALPAGIPIAYSAAAGAGVFLCTLAVSSLFGKTPELPDYSKAGLQESKLKLFELRSSLSKVFDGGSNLKMRRLVEQAELILKKAEKEPHKFKQVRTLYQFSLESALKVSRGYAEFGTKRAGNEDTVKKLDESLELLQKAFEAQNKKLLEDVMMDIDVELEVLKKTLKMEGL